VRRLAVLLLLFILTYGCTQSQVAVPPASYETIIGSPSYYETHNPIDLLDSLRRLPHSVCLVAPANDWVKEYHIPVLIGLLDCNDSCANVTAIYSSFTDYHKSTIGHEAAFLILGFRRGKYPPIMNSTHMMWSKQEILQWWKEYKEIHGKE